MNIVRYIIKAMYIHVAVKQMGSFILAHKMCPCEKYFLLGRNCDFVIHCTQKSIKLNPETSISVEMKTKQEEIVCFHTPYSLNCTAMLWKTTSIKQRL